jgi:L-lactate utilization protein LutB
MGTTANEIKAIWNNKLGPKVVEFLKKRRFEAWYFSNREDALKQLYSLIPKEHVVAWGGSLTMEALEIQKTASKRYTVINRDAAKSPEERVSCMRSALTCDTFIMGANAISEDGQIVNIDGGGNRVAALIYGPKQVIVAAGMNKVVKTLDDAVTRTRTVASPKNQQRFPDHKTPCTVNGSCGDCISPDCICAQMVITRFCNPPGRIKVILINEDLGL